MREPLVRKNNRAGFFRGGRVEHGLKLVPCAGLGGLGLVIWLLVFFVIFAPQVE